MTVRVGVIGTGFARRVQLPGLRLVPGAVVTAVASRDRARAAAVAREFDIAHAFGSGEELARSGDVDLVIVSSTPDAHARHAIAALEAGKHVLCEKPMALTAREAEQMVEVAERSPGCARIDHELRYEPNRRRARELIGAGGIGPVLHLELVVSYLRGDGRPQACEAPWSWWHDAARGGGILGAVGSHLIDLCRFWTAGDVVEVSGRVATFVPERRDEHGVARAVTADDFASFVMRLASGAVATITLTTFAFHGPGHFARVTGLKGSLVLTVRRSSKSVVRALRSRTSAFPTSCPDKRFRTTCGHARACGCCGISSASWRGGPRQASPPHSTTVSRSSG